MLLKLNVVSKTNPRNLSEAPKYYACHTASEFTKENRILEEVASQTGYTQQFCSEVLDSLLNIISQKLKAGHLVKIKELGSFSLSISSIGHELPEQVTAKSIKKIRVHFKPDKSIKKRLREVEFEKPEIPKPQDKSKVVMPMIEK